MQSAGMRLVRQEYVVAKLVPSRQRKARAVLIPVDVVEFDGVEALTFAYSGGP
jgi:hypothetical protein